MAEQDARERLLRAAAELFYGRGIGATGIDAITARAGVAKMSLYNNFSSKADLIEAYLRARRDEWLELYHERVKEAANPRDRILAVFDSYIDHAELARHSGFRGCGLLNASAELPAGDPGRTLVALQKNEVEQLFRQHLLELIPDGFTVDGAAEHLSYLLEGAMSRGGIEGNSARLERALGIASAIVDKLSSSKGLAA
ncbi:hypothetical protein N185_16690 [Sinorhizobium sp. GW3]|nr:hypothetical protein N185_16690 [Sinorhizobium sp. GW3]